MPARTARPISRGTSRGLNKTEISQVAVIHTAIVLFYLMDGLFLWMFEGLQVISSHIGIEYVITGVSLSFWHIIYFRLGRRTVGSLQRNNVSLTLSAFAVMCATAFISPSIGGFMMMTMLTVLPAAALQLDTRYLALLYVVFATGATSAILTIDHPFQWPMASLMQRAVTALWFGWLLAKCAAINAMGTRLRHIVLRTNAQLTLTLTDTKMAAMTDELTSLPNRRAMISYLNRSLEALPDSGAYVAVALFDIDNFKSVNDKFGHTVGDDVLRRFGLVASKNLRPRDSLGRYGGEEFLLIIRGIENEMSAHEAVERVRKSIEEYDWQSHVDKLRITVSAGLALVKPNESGNAAIGRADAALYCAKSGGRNRVVSAPPIRLD